MKQNMGSIDKIVRVLAAVVIGVLYFVFLLTSAIGFCPLYLPLKLSTIKKKDA